MTKITVIGNCQARPLANILRSNTHLDVSHPIILHLANSDDSEEHEKTLADADLVLAQATSDAFEPSHLRSASLKQQFPEKVIVWPNIFYLGQTPYLRYLTHPKLGRIMGPLDAYHDLRLLHEWYILRFGRPILSAEFDPLRIAMRSLENLKLKESACDVHISDLIVEHVTYQQLFFTFNHPKKWLLVQLAQRISRLAEFKLPPPEKQSKEPLDLIIPPNTLQDLGTPNAQFKGMDLSDQSPKPGKLYTAQELRSVFFQTYDRITEHLADPDTLRFTPDDA